MLIDSTQIRVLLADDAGLVRSGVRALLDRIATVKVVGETGESSELLKVIRQSNPDILLIHAAISRVSCLELAHDIRKDFPKLRLVLLSEKASGEYIQRALRSGYSGFLLLTDTADQLELAITTVIGGETFVSDAGLKHLAEFKSVIERLTARQREVLKLIAQGQSTKEIARNLNISVKTVESHRMQITERLDIHDTASLVRYAINVGLVDLD